MQALEPRAHLLGGHEGEGLAGLVEGRHHVLDRRHRQPLLDVQGYVHTQAHAHTHEASATITSS
jgi:hypothetical protein